MYPSFKKTKAFTIVEIIIAIVILAIISAIVFPAFVRYRATMDLKGFADNFAHVMKYAKETAKTVEGSRVEFTRKPEDENKNDYPVGYLYFEIKKPDGTVKKKMNIPPQISIWGVPLADNYYDFKADGTLDLSDDLNLTIKSTGTKIEGNVLINKVTGGIDLQFQEP
ncbi:MAG: prepilin-type N-terminal cleavage/methylation domain-containing protein [Candidatus Eremiobacteraeota bacterium]|nr:prepilin-type N-terminal cleavage/methylation domain-containing protein [Candidatus Eremiobacteraeota bacterium]